MERESVEGKAAAQGDLHHLARVKVDEGDAQRSSQIAVAQPVEDELVELGADLVGEAAREVEDGLAGFQGSRASANFLADSVASAQRSVDLSLIQYREGATDYQRVLDSQQSLLAQQDQYTSAKGGIVQNLVSVYRALGGGWQIRAGQEFLPEERLQRMRERTDWGELLPGEQLPDELPEAPPTGNAQPLLNPPVW